jgi:hypothetical protein
MCLAFASGVCQNNANPMSFGNKTKLVLKVVAVYGLLWLLTATWGNHDVDCDFDRQFSVGNGGSPLGGPVVPTPVVRIHELPNPKNLDDPKNKGAIPENPWRFRNGAIAVAPFVIIDEIAFYRGGMEAHSWRRMTFWFFGYTKSTILKHYWT